jgi:TolB-like protein
MRIGISMGEVVIASNTITNMSGDAEQDNFADGMAEDLITDLSKISGLFVIAQNSSFSYECTHGSEFDAAIKHWIFARMRR